MERRFRFYVTINPTADQCETDSLESALTGAKTLWNDAIDAGRSPDGVAILLREITEQDGDPYTTDPHEYDRRL